MRGIKMIFDVKIDKSQPHLCQCTNAKECYMEPRGPITCKGCNKPMNIVPNTMRIEEKQ